MSGGQRESMAVSNVTGTSPSGPPAEPLAAGPIPDDITTSTRTNEDIAGAEAEAVQWPDANDDKPMSLQQQSFMIANIPAKSQSDPKQLQPASSSKDLIVEHTIDQDKEQLTPTTSKTSRATRNFSGSVATSTKPRRPQLEQLAPLASLDCSITEPLTSESTTVCGSGSRSPVTDTPTLSGYFDCDQLSDMIDDSLFELTTAGCLSKSVATSPQAFGASSRGTDNYQDDSAPATPTNERPTWAESRSTKTRAAASVGGQRAATSAKSATCRQVAAGNSSISKLRDPMTSGGLRQQQRPEHQAGASTRRNSQRKARSQPDVRGVSEAGEPSGGQRAIDQVANNSNSDFGAGELCLVCGGKRKKSHKVEERKKRKRFSFSLFNLFTGAIGGAAHRTSSAENVTDDKLNGSGDNRLLRSSRRCCCSGDGRGSAANRNNILTSSASSSSIMTSGKSSKTANNATTTTRRRRPIGGAGSGGPAIRARDSIKLTNERNQRGGNSSGRARDQATALRLSSSYQEFRHSINNSNNNNNHASKQEPEVLLDLAIGSRQLRYRQQLADAAGTTSSSNDSSRDFDNCAASRYHFGAYNQAPNISRARAISQSSGLNGRGKSSTRQAKSVKFTTPDRVMILNSNGEPSKRQTSAGQLAQASQLQPPAPIIKRTVPKSSSYSQTDSNGYLDELLAKYEVNDELIAQINERLKLTETIASPKSALDEMEDQTKMDSASGDSQLDGETTQCNNSGAITSKINLDNEKPQQQKRTTTASALIIANSNVEDSIAKVDQVAAEDTSDRNGRQINADGDTSTSSAEPNSNQSSSSVSTKANGNGTSQAGTLAF